MWLSTVLQARLCWFEQRCGVLQTFAYSRIGPFEVLCVLVPWADRRTANINTISGVHMNQSRGFSINLDVKNHRKIS